MEENQISFGKQILNALIHFLYTFINFLFVLPYDLWKKAVVRLDSQYRNKTLHAATITSQWPFFSWMKRFVLEFLIDGLIFIWPLIAIIAPIIANSELDGGFLGFIIMLYALYFGGPFALSLLRDNIIVTLVLPFRKFLSWMSKPAQYLDIKHDGNIKNN